MERFATNKNGNIDSGTEVLANNVTFLQQAKDLAISNLFKDLFVEGILNTGDASTMFQITSNNDGTFNVGQGVAYKRNVSVEPALYERIAIEDTDAEYNSANPSQTTFDGVDQNVPTPKSTGCKNISIPSDGVVYYVDLRYLSVCDNGNTGDGLGLTNYSIAKNQISTSPDQRKRFYKWVDGYEIVLVETTAGIQGVCLGTVLKDGTNVIITDNYRTQNLLIESRVIMDYFTSGKGIVIETNTTTNQTTLSVNVDDVTTEIEDNYVRVTKDGLYPFTKFAVNSGPTTFLTNSGNIVSLTVADIPLWVNPAYNDRYSVIGSTGVTSIDVWAIVQSQYSSQAGIYTVCINNTDISNGNESLATPKLEVMNKVHVGTSSPTSNLGAYDIWLDLSSQPYQAKWYDGSQWQTYNGVPLGLFQIDNGAIISNGLVQMPFNKDYSKWGEIGKIVPYATTTLREKCLLGDGSEISKLLYNDLFRLIGNTFGSPVNSNNFVLPDFTNKAIWGGTFSNIGTYIAAGIPNHTHAVGRQSKSNTGQSIWDREGKSFKLSNNVGKMAWNGSDSFDNKSEIPDQSDITALGDYYTQETSLAHTENISSDGVFGNKTTVQPPALQVPILIRAIL